jgi:hypothetical protein
MRKDRSIVKDDAFPANHGIVNAVVKLSYGMLLRLPKRLALTQMRIFDIKVLQKVLRRLVLHSNTIYALNGIFVKMQEDGWMLNKYKCFASKY